jgi:hypothetical protein
MKDIDNWDNQLIRETFPEIIVYDKENIKIKTVIE